MHSVLPVDKSGIPLGNAIIWADNRGVKEAELLKSLPQNESIFHTTGTPIHPMSPLIKITWIKKELENKTHVKGYKNKPLTEEDFEQNRQKSTTRARVEHVFGFMEGSMNTMKLKQIGKGRIEAAVGMMNLVYNMFRKIQLDAIS